jgi:Polyketide cyclase / dehydrase and lipid transport.
MVQALAIQGAEWTDPDQPLTDEGFEVIARERGVTVYQHKDAKNIRVAAEGIINAPPEQVAQALLDYEHQRGVIKRVSESKILEHKPRFLIVYQHLNLPIISDRDYTLFVTWGTSGKLRWIVYRAITERGPPEKDGIVRVTEHDGSWQLTPLGINGENTQLRFQMTIDLAGWLPRWLARSKAGDEVPDLYASIRALVLNEANVQKGKQSCTSKSC